MADSIHPSDFFIAMAHYLPESRKSFVRDMHKLGCFIYEQKKVHPDVLSEFRINWDGVYPSSDELYQSITSLFGSGLMVSLGFGLMSYQFHPDCEESYARFVSQRVPAEILSEIEEIAKKFDTQLGQENIFNPLSLK